MLRTEVVEKNKIHALCPVHFIQSFHIQQWVQLEPKGWGDFYYIYTAFKLYLFYSFDVVLCLQYDFEAYIKQFMCT
jgi:hypothetical protein